MVANRFYFGIYYSKSTNNFVLIYVYTIYIANLWKYAVIRKKCLIIYKTKYYEYMLTKCKNRKVFEKMFMKKVFTHFMAKWFSTYQTFAFAI
jgi:hypothetical protein